MGETKKVKRKKFNLLKFLIFVLFLYILFYIIMYVLKEPIRNIVVMGTNNITDEEIIEISNLDNYPSFIRTSSSKICKKIKKLELVESCKINKKFGYIVEINIDEKQILYKKRSDDSFILSDGTVLKSNNSLSGIPTLINYVPEEIEKKLIDKFSKVKENILFKISEIEYSSTSYDNERFILYMTDGNMVYITLSKITNLNKYDDIKEKLEGHAGILYLDSGNYFEIKE